MRIDNKGFVSKVMERVRFGFAAGCAAVAVPAVDVPLMLLGYALDAACGP